MGLKMAKIIFLNGVSSVGKTSIAKALQTILQEPYIHLGIDHVFEWLPQEFINDPHGIVFETSEENSHPLVKIKMGDYGNNVFKGMRAAMAAFAEQGNNLVIDEVLLSNELEDYTNLLADFQVHYVGIFAPLAVIEERERIRGDRHIGLARWQYNIVHQNKTYDLEIDNTTLSPLACAKIIQEKFKLK